ncbi:MAG: 2-phospho-L-lactate/phosphoenolpyruvate guanylyltransferase [Nocardioidaceae bacterium]|jgi:2-phospho-L-lactate guanylyltransferase|nr:2-phospho-L-lactate/phosphoenolpyruvate guanylyltransferase [Nocardioidaceae bacterium]
MTPHHARPVPAWTIIIPVKNTSVAKTRLRRFDQTVRATLAQAFALDSATAALGCPLVRQVVAVTNDEPAGRALVSVGVEIIADTPDDGLNRALVHGVDVVRRNDPSAAVAAMSGDLPALRAEDLSAAFDAAVGVPRWFVADATGTGTTLLAAGTGARLRPAFGADSREQHRKGGAVDLASGDLARLRRDVDTEDDLRDAALLGLGPFTMAALARLDGAADFQK